MHPKYDKKKIYVNTRDVLENKHQTDYVHMFIIREKTNLPTRI